MVRTGLVAGMAVNRHVADAPSAMDGVYDETRCIAGGCMMWRDSYCGLAGNYISIVTPVATADSLTKIAKMPKHA